MDQRMNTEAHEGSDRLERLLAEHYRAQTAEIRATPMLWARLEPQLAARSGRRPALSGARLYLLASACALAVLAIAISLAVRSGWTPGVPRLALAGPTVASPGTPFLPVGPTAPSPGADHTPTMAGTTGPAGTATPAPFVTQPPISGSPRLNKGPLEEAQRAVGLTARFPRYLPEGAVREDEDVFYSVQDGQGLLAFGYRVGQRHLNLQFDKPPLGSPADGYPERVGPFDARVYTTVREPSDPLPPLSMVAWRDGDVSVQVSGDLPVEELLKVARSLY